MSTRSDILALFSSCELQGLTDNNFPSLLFQHLPSSYEFTYNYGASKLVLLPANANYVIKIPFAGTEQDYDDYYDEEDEDFDPFTPNENANNSYEHDWDYCYTEVLNYHLAEKARLQNIFCKTSYLGVSADDYPIYIQQKAELLADRNERISRYGYSSERINNSYHKISTSTYLLDEMDPCWMTDAIEYYGAKTINRFCDFCDANFIEDFHNGNLGYINNRPVILDYSNWNEDKW